ncbi:MAG: class I SAM-dependent methyltransferase [Candidatus Omnitrophota bacterium]
MTKINSLLKSQEASLRKRIKKYREVAAELKAHLDAHPSDWGKYQSVFNQEINAIFRDLMVFEQERLSKNDEVSVYKLKRIFINHLRADFLHGEHICWSLKKPYGYAGDFKIIDDIYRNDPRTEGFARLFDNYAQMSAAAFAIRNRKEDIKKFIGSLIKSNNGKAIKIMDLASGPCRDINEMLEEIPSDQRNLSIDCYDQDENAIEYAKTLLGSNLKFVNFYKENAVRIAFKKSIPNERYDLIFSLGLFDYLDERLAQRLIRALKELLKPNGVLFIANFGEKQQNPSFYFLEWVGEWQLIYRSEEEFRKIFLEAGFDEKNLRTIFEQQGIIQYVVAQNPS